MREMKGKEELLVNFGSAFVKMQITSLNKEDHLSKTAADFIHEKRKSGRKQPGSKNMNEAVT